MLVDIVIDANVFLHAENDQEQRRPSCQMLIGLLTDLSTKLCVDEEFSFEESSNRSIIGHEYIKHLRAGSVGYVLVSHLAQSDRISILPRKVHQSASRHIRQISRGPDRIYICVAHNSHDKVFASHDFNDIPATVRVRILDALNIKIVDAAEAVLVIQSANV